MGDIKIIEYSPANAKAIADMWNKSGENWGGINAITTEDYVLNEHAGATHLNVYLAVQDEEVLGYCSFSKYAEDEGALYIPLLNARPDCHGKGVGKALVKKTVERTIELDWPRLDLYTWPGNTKAVPLYKKCGFFWERRDDTTHLINLIPYVMQTEAVEDFFKIADWYNDSKRVIEVKPDGKEENKFDYFEYCWEKDGRQLRLEFERRGRGLRLIETDDYLVKATVENLNLVFGKSYKIYYDVINKSGKPLEISFKGADNKNIKFSYDKSAVITDTYHFEGEFYVDKIEEEQSEWRTHPVVYTELLINGKKALFKNGILPKFPAMLDLVVPESKGIKGAKAIFFIDIESNIDQDAVFEFELEPNEDIELGDRNYKIELKALERKSIEVPYSLINNCFYKTKSNIRATVGGELISFDKTLTAIFRGSDKMFGGETDEFWFIANGDYLMKLNKFDNEIYLNGRVKDEYTTFFMYPKLGMPFSTEFSKTKPYRVDMYEQKNAMIMDAYYKSEDFSYIEFKAVAKLYLNGILEHSYEVTNTSDRQTDEIWLNDSVYNEIYKSVIPYNGKFIDIESSYYSSMDYWDLEKFTENWIFSYSHKVSRGVSWGKNTKAVFEGWFMRLENNLGHFDAHETKKTDPVVLAVGAFDSWEAFRAYVTGVKGHDYKCLTEHLDFVVNNNNPFVGKCFKADIIMRRFAYFDGKLLISSNGKQLAEKLYKLDDKATVSSFEVEVEAAKVQKLSLKVDFEDIEFQKTRTVFASGDKAVQLTQETIEDKKIITADNGLIKLKADPDFSNSIFSMTYNGNEWLDTSYPTPGPKSWFNPWTGGMEIRPDKFQPASAAREPKSAELAELRDSVGNIWNGIKTSLYIKENKSYKGMTINQYFMLLPQVPVLCYTAEFDQNSGSYIDSIPYYNFAFLKAADDITKTWAKLTDGNGVPVKHKCGKVRQDIQTSSFIQFGSEERADTVTVVTDSKNELQMLFANNQLVSNHITGRLNIANGTKSFIAPIFFVFGTEELEYGTLKDLIDIKF